ncbi:ABC transporter permease, partial [Klebsiella aerogenes]
LYLFLLAPILIVVPLSFSNDAYLTFPPESWGLRWYAALLRHDGIAKAFWVSLGLASLVTVLALCAGIPAAYAIRRFTFRGRDALMN